MNGEKVWKIEYFDEIASTNEYVKEKRKDRQNRIAIAYRQSGGKGTKGRSFSSETGGVYLSVLTFYENFPAKDAFLIMANAAAAVVKTLESFGFSPVIKWANDIFVDGKKICGILIENTFSGQNVDSSVVGIGLNVNNELPAELLDIATTMSKAGKKEFDRKQVEKRLIEELKKTHTVDEYLQYVGFMGKKATLVCGETAKKVTLVSVDKQGGLTVLTERGEEERFVAAEISIRLGETL